MKTCRSPLWAILALSSTVSVAFAAPVAAAAPAQQGRVAPKSAAAEPGGLATPWRGGAFPGSASWSRQVIGGTATASGAGAHNPGAPAPAVTQAQAALSSGPFNKIWTVALSQYNQAAETGESLTQLSNGTIVVGGDDSHLQNYCSTRKNPLYGGAWLVAATPSSGSNVWQNLYSTCATAAQTTSSVSRTADGGLILAGGDFDNPACGNGCGWFAKLGAGGSIAWQHDLIGAPSAGADAIQPTSDGGYIAVGNESPTGAGILEGLIMKITSTGSLQWTQAYSEANASFPGAFAGGNFTFESVQQTPDGGYITSGVADAKFSSGYANALVVMKLDASGTVQWSNVYYGANWDSGPAGDSQYPIFQTPDGGYILSGTVQASAYPFENLFFLLKLDARGNIAWQKGYGGTNSGYDVSREAGGAYATSDGGYVLAGESNIFLHAATGWIVKTDASGNILWQKTYTGLTPGGGNVINDIIQTSDGGYTAAGDSWTANPTYGGPGLWLVTTDSTGNVGTCSCAQNTNTAPQPLDLGLYQASFARVPSGLSFSGVNIKAKATSVTPTTIYP
jgi:hypothetical protein